MMLINELSQEISDLKKEKEKTEKKLDSLKNEDLGIVEKVKRSNDYKAGIKALAKELKAKETELAEQTAKAKELVKVYDEKLAACEEQAGAFYATALEALQLYSKTISKAFKAFEEPLEEVKKVKRELAGLDDLNVTEVICLKPIPKVEPLKKALLAEVKQYEKKLNSLV